MGIIRGSAYPGFIVVLAAILCSCAHQSAQVGDVWSTKYTETIPPGDRALYATDRASHLRVESQPLPADQQREEILVTWGGSAVSLVKLEYRQVNIPDKILVQTFPVATDRHSNVFAVVGDDYRNGGPISAWRVSLWEGETLLVERKSTLW